MNLFRGEVEVEIGGQKRLLKFGINTLAVFSEKSGKGLEELSFGVADLRGLIWAALYTGARKQGTELEADEWTVGEWLDDIEEDQFNLIMRTITESMPQPDAKKKTRKSPGKTS